MKLETAISRDKKKRKERYGMVVSNKSIFVFDRVSSGLPKRKRKK